MYTLQSNDSSKFVAIIEMFEKKYENSLKMPKADVFEWHKIDSYTKKKSIFLLFLMIYNTHTSINGRCNKLTFKLAKNKRHCIYYEIL